jgi:putative glutathione S-transferase
MSATPTAHAFRDRIGPSADHGHHPVPHRYRLHVSLACPGCLRLAVAHRLLGLDDRVPLVPLPAVPDEADGGYAALRPYYAATAHRATGPAAAPLLTDDWTGRAVSNHGPGILRDLAVRFRRPGDPDLFPAGAERAVADVARRCARDVGEAAQRAGLAGAAGEGRARALAVLLTALGELEDRLARGPFVLGGTLTAADLYLWTTLVELDTVHRWHLDAAAVHRIADHPRLWAYARRLLAEPAFGSLLRPDDIARRHHHRCRGLEAAGAAVQIIDWTAAPAPADGAGLVAPAARRRG